MPIRHDGDALDSDGGTVHDPRFDVDRLDNLTLLALGETVPATFESHHLGCARCQDDLAALSHTVTLGREGAAHREYLDAQPPASVWSAIWAHRGNAADTEPDVTGAHPAGDQTSSNHTVIDHIVIDHPAIEHAPINHAPVEPTAVGQTPVTHTRVSHTPGDSAPDVSPRPVDAGVQAPRSVRGPAATARPHPALRSRYGLAAAAVVLAMAGATGGYLAGHSAGSAQHRLASDAHLTQVPGGPAPVAGAAALRSAGDGKQLSVTTAGLPLRSGFYEVWLYDPDRGRGGDMVAIGALGDHGRGTFTLPSGIDIRAYHVVNISAQNYGAGSSIVHGTSVLQGSLNE